MIRAFLYSNLFIAICAAMLVAGTFRAFSGARPEWSLVVLVFSATLLVYCLDRLVGADREDRVEASDRHRWSRRRGQWLRGGVVSGGLGVVSGALALQPQTVALLGVLGVISIGYAFPLGRGGRRLKELPGMKTVLVALVWSVATVMVPAMEAGWSPLAREVVKESALRGLFVFGLTLPFDVRDRRRDQAAGFQTLAVLLGPGGTRGTAIFAMALVVALSGWSALGGGVLSVPTLGVSGLTLSIFLVFPQWERRPEWFFVGVLDGMLFLLGLLLYFDPLSI